MIAALIVILYAVVGIVSTWFTYELFKQKTLLEQRKRSKPRYQDRYMHNNKWEMHHEKEMLGAAIFCNTLLWPITLPYIYLKDQAVQNDKQLVKNPMKYIVKELVDPKENI